MSNNATSTEGTIRPTKNLVINNNNANKNTNKTNNTSTSGTGSTQPTMLQCSAIAAVQVRQKHEMPMTLASALEKCSRHWKRVGQE